MKHTRIGLSCDIAKRARAFVRGPEKWILDRAIDGTGNEFHGKPSAAVIAIIEDILSLDKTLSNSSIREIIEFIQTGKFSERQKAFAAARKRRQSIPYPNCGARLKDFLRMIVKGKSARQKRLNFECFLILQLRKDREHRGLQLYGAPEEQNRKDGLIFDYESSILLRPVWNALACSYREYLESKPALTDSQSPLG